MSIALLIEKNFKEDFSKNKINVPILEVEKANFSKLKKYNVLILLTNKILNRKETNYKKISLFTKRNNIKLIEIAFEKSNISQERTFSEAIMYGFGINTFKLIRKIIKDFRIQK